MTAGRLLEDMNMHRRVRRIAAAFLVAITLVGSVSPAMAARESEMAMENIDPLADLMVLRPVGLVAFAIGTILFIVPVAPLALISRPDGIGVAWNRLVVAPAKYVWVDPLGSH
jgi:hypothetical protein